VDLEPAAIESLNWCCGCERRITFMKRTELSPFVDLAGLRVGEDRTLSAQLETKLRDAIREGRYRPGDRLPSARRLAEHLDLSRNTVERALAQLVLEGYVERERGSGSYVADPLPSDALQPAIEAASASDESLPTLSARGRRMASLPIVSTQVPNRALIPGYTANDVLPRRSWTNVVNQVSRQPEHSIMAAGARAGLPALREAIAAYLGPARGITCSAAQVIITNSTQQSLDRAARMILDPGDTAWIEEPSYIEGRGVLRLAALELAAIPVDAEGLSVEAGMLLAPHARAAYVTPSCQYPTGVTMTLRRRQALLDWARAQDGWIIEDDYDGAFRYEGQPVVALHGLDGGRRVLFAGSFNKVMFPSLRIGFLVVPEWLVEQFTLARLLLDGPPPLLLQAAMAEFIASGQFATHIRTLRGFYLQRRNAFLDMLRACEDDLMLGPHHAGTHILARFRRPMSDMSVFELALRRGVAAHRLSLHYHQPPGEQGFVLGYSLGSLSATRSAVRVLADALGEAHRLAVPRIA
jgi:GntR family transcriptional regulator/MocR family aminotransferase